MSHTKMYLAGAVIAAASLVASGPAFATATNLLFDDGPSGTSLIISVDGTVVNTVGPIADNQDVFNSFGEFVTGSFSIPMTDISILDLGTSLVSDQLQFSAIDFGNGTTLTISFFGSNDIQAVPLPISNPVFETGLTQTLLSETDQQGDTLDVQFLSEVDAPTGTTSVPEPSTLALFGTALAAFGMMMRRRTVRSHA